MKLDQPQIGETEQKEGGPLTKGNGARRGTGGVDHVRRATSYLLKSEWNEETSSEVGARRKKARERY